MKTVPVDTINTRHLYLIKKGTNEMLATGQEVITNFIQSKINIPKDTVIQLAEKSVYRINSKLYTGQEIAAVMNTPAPVDFPSIAFWGSFFLGFVIGWNLYLINRHRTKTNVIIGDIATIVSALIGAAALAFFDKNFGLVGWYGVGVGTGFLVYGIIFALLVVFGKKPEDPLPYEILRTMGWDMDNPKVDK